MSKHRDHMMPKNSLASPYRLTLLFAGVALVALLTRLPAHALAQNAPQTQPSDKAVPKGNTKAEQELLDLSKQKWQWMADRKVEDLDNLFHDKAEFTHMGGTWGKAQELGIIKGGQILYKHADIKEASVRVIGPTAIVLNRIQLLAVVGGNEVSNPFEVTEVYVQQDGVWKLLQLSFSHLTGR